MKLQKFNELIGQDSYVRCQGKERVDPAIVNIELAKEHLNSGGTIGWWVRPNYIIVDIDEGKKQALEVIKKLKLKTLMCKTPKGIHLYFKTNRDYAQKIGMILPFGLKCDFRCANKGYVILPYGIDKRAFNKQINVIEMPLEFTPIPKKDVESLLNKKEGDGRNASLFAHLMAYKNRGASNTQVEEMAKIINSTIFAEPMEESELEKIVENTRKYKAKAHGDNPYLIYNGKGVPSQINSRAVCDYFVNRGDLFVLGGDCYQYREGVYVEANSYVRNTIKEMVGVDSLITQARIMETYRLIVDDTRIQRKSSDLNSNVDLINFLNGVWDIQNRKLMPHDTKYLHTLQIPHEVKKANKSWKKTELYKFLKGIVCLEQTEIEMISDYMAYCLTLNFGLKTFMILQGPSNTGKSVLIRFFESLIGYTNISSLSMGELAMRFYPALLYNKLLNSCGDDSSLPLKSIKNLKKITGGDQIMHEKKGKEPFFFIPFAKLLLSFNQMPLQLEEKSNAFYKRMRVLSMQKELFLNDEYVNKLCSKQSIEETIPHLLHRLPIKKIPTTKTSDALVEGLRKDSDSIHAFITTCCVKGDKKWVSKKAIYEKYVNFCINQGREAHKLHAFMRRMRALGLVEARHAKTREYCWKGIGIRRDIHE